MSLDRIGASSIVQAVKDKGVKAIQSTSELIYSVEAHLKGSSFTEMVNRGKLVALSAMGMMEGSTAGPLFHHRIRGLLTTRRILEAIDGEYKTLVADAAAVATSVERLCGLLNQFRQCCDAHITLSIQEEEAVAQREAENESFVDITTCGDDLAKTIGVERHSEKDQHVLAFQRKMSAMIAELRETVEVNCSGICNVAIGSIDDTYRTVSHDVTNAKTALDLHRRKVQGLKDSLARLRLEVHGIPDSHSQKALRTMQMEQSEASLSAKIDEEGQLRAQFESEVQRALHTLHYTLEQSSMSAWSVYNISFSQMSNFFQDAATESKEIAKTFAELKNNQRVSRSISDEKKEMLQRHSAQSTSGPHTPPPTMAAIPSPQGPSTTEVDDFEDFLSERASSSDQPRIGGAATAARPAPKTSAGGAGSDVWDELFGGKGT